MKKGLLITLIILLILAVVVVVFYNFKDSSIFNKEVEKTEDETLSLYGEWKQTNSSSDTAYFVATINEDDTMIINWVSEEDNTKSLYWAGTFTAPTDNSNSYTWASENDKEQTDNALLASTAETKKFNYENGIISYEASALGTTTTIEMEKIN